MDFLAELNKHSNKAQLLNDVALQLEKDLNRSGIQTGWTADELADPVRVIENLRDILHTLYETDRGKLSTIMYSVDLSEREISRQLNRPNAREMPEELAVLILKRVLQKVVLRSYYGKLG